MSEKMTEETTALDTYLEKIQGKFKDVPEDQLPRPPLLKVFTAFLLDSPGLMDNLNLYYSDISDEDMLIIYGLHSDYRRTADRDRMDFLQLVYTETVNVKRFSPYTVADLHAWVGYDPVLKDWWQVRFTYDVIRVLHEAGFTHSYEATALGEGNALGNLSFLMHHPEKKHSVLVAFLPERVLADFNEVSSWVKTK